jgi:hypothetical protein
VITPAAPLPMGIEPLGHDEVKIVLGTGHRDVEQATLFLDFFCGASGEIGRDAAIDTVDSTSMMIESGR